ncbi:MAG: glycosyltransferase family 2 protein [Pseudomonadota bacterium]
MTAVMERPENQSTTQAKIELAVVVPCFNENENVAELLKRLDAALQGVEWEAIFVDDDSPDGTANTLRELAQQDRRVRVIQRLGRRGLSTAVLEGMMATPASYIAVIDADLQHDERILSDMLKKAKDGADVVVGTRYAQGGGTGDWDKTREGMSRFATKLANIILPTELSDPMSGFFLISRQTLESSMRQVSGQGFKILLDILSALPKTVKVEEVSYVFRSRHAGESKLDSAVLLAFAEMLLEKTIGRFVPVRFVMFAGIGGLGLILHLAVMFAAIEGFAASFVLAQASATVVAIAFNFTLNNTFTFRDQRLKGWRWLSGLLSFYAVCGLGAAANVGVANVVFERDYSWWLAAISGVLVGAVWNYAVSTVFTWKK